MEDYQSLKIIVPLELTKDQEEVFIRSFQLIREGVLDNFKKQAKITGNIFYKMTAREHGEAMNNLVRNVIQNIDEFLVLNQDPQDKKIYYFRVASAQFDFTRHLPGQIIDKGPMAERLFSAIKENLKKEVLPRIAVDYNEVKFEVIQ